MTVEQLKNRKTEFVDTMSKYKEFSDKLNHYDDLLRERFEECHPFDDFSWKMLEFGIENYLVEFFYDFLDKDTICDDCYYFVYELEWGKKSSIDREFDIKIDNDKFYLNSIESLWNYLIYEVEKRNLT